MTHPNPPPPDVGIDHAVEAAVDVLKRHGYQIYPSGAATAAVTEAISAADQVRGRSWIDWRRPEEWNQSDFERRPRFILLEDNDGDVRHYRVGDTIHFRAPPYCRRWSEMPSPHAGGETTTALESQVVATDTMVEGARAAWNVEGNGDRWLSLTDLRTIVEGAMSARTATGQCAHFPEPCRSVSSCMHTGKCIRQAEAEQGARTATDGERSPDPRIAIIRAWCLDHYGVSEMEDAEELIAEVEGVTEVVTREDAWRMLRMLVDKAWQEATASPDTPATKMADEIIETVFGPCVAPAISPAPSTHETPGAAVLAGGAPPDDCLFPKNCASARKCLGFKCRHYLAGDAARISDLELQVVALGKGGADTQEELMTQGSRIAALEKRPGWTGAERRLFRHIAQIVFSERKRHEDYVETGALIDAAFPETRP